MKLLAPFITMIGLAIFFASVGLVSRVETETTNLIKAYLPIIQILLFIGLGVSVVWFSVWVLRK